jgi:hypothetical protein
MSPWDPPSAWITEEVTMSSIDISTASGPAVPIRGLGDSHRAHLRARTLDAWREAEGQVQARWDELLAADRPSRRRTAFAAYMAALDAEAATAAALSQTHLDLPTAA